MIIIYAPIPIPYDWDREYIHEWLREWNYRCIAHDYITAMQHVK